MEKKLTTKQSAFVTFYMETFNGTKAAKLAKYQGDELTLANVACQNLKKPHIAAEIAKRMKILTMPAEEVILRLDRLARATIEDFIEIDDETGEYKLSLVKAEERGSLGVIKHIHQTKKVKVLKNGEHHTTYSTQLTLHDSQAALEKLGKFYNLFSERLELRGVDDGAIPIRVINYGLDTHDDDDYDDEYDDEEE